MSRRPLATFPFPRLLLMCSLRDLHITDRDTLDLTGVYILWNRAYQTVSTFVRQIKQCETFRMTRNGISLCQLPAQCHLWQ